jgi:glycosyltransferase involved in cell wall biosynthesis
MTAMKTKFLLIATGVASGNSGISGGESRFIEIAKHWQKKGHQINLLGSRGSRSLCRKMGLKVRFHQSMFEPGRTRFSIITRIFKIFVLSPSLSQIKKGIVYSTNEQLYDVIPGLILKLKNRSLKWAVVVHWLPSFLFWKRKQSTPINSLFFLISQRLSLYLACIFADRLLAVSDSTLDQIKKDPLARFFAHKAVSVACGVDVKKVKHVAKKSGKKEYDAVFMKRIQAVKGIFDLIETWSLVVKKKPKAKLIIIGSGHDQEAAKNLVAEYGLDKNISFLGPIYDFNEKFTYIAKSKLFLLPTFEENWAIVIGEAMAANTPVITYGLKELKSVWKKFATYVPVGNQSLFAKKIIEQLSNYPIRRSIASKASSFIEEYDWKNIATKELDFVCRLQDPK